MIKPLAYNLITRPSKFSALPIFNDYHDTNLKSWNDYYTVIGLFDSEVDSSDIEYEKYCKWVEMLNSPLYKALKED